MTWAGEGWMATLRDSGTGLETVAFGDGLAGTPFYPAGPDGKPKAAKLPVVVWLHPYSYAYGWSARSPWSDNTKRSIAERPSFASPL